MRDRPHYRSAAGSKLFVRDYPVSMMVIRTTRPQITRSIVPIRAGFTGSAHSSDPQLSACVTLASVPLKRRSQREVRPQKLLVKIVALQIGYTIYLVNFVRRK